MFNSNYRNLQQNSNLGDDGVIAGATIRNIAEAESNGVELDMRYQFASDWAISVNSSWLNANFIRYEGADCTRLQSVVANTDVAAQFGAQLGAQGTGNGNGNRQNCSQDLSGAAMHMAPDFSSFLRLSHQTNLAHFTLSSQLEWFYSEGFFTSPHADLLRYQPHFNKLSISTTLAPNNAPWQLSLLVRNITNKLTSRQLGQDGNAAVSGLLDPPRFWSIQFRYRY